MKKQLCLSLFVALSVIWSNISFGYDRTRIDPEGKIPAHHLKVALDSFELNKDKIRNQDYLVVIDYKAHNSKERFFLIDLNTGDVESYLTAHGKNSDPDFDGYATKFSNTIDSKQTSLGLFLTAETYFGENGYSLRLDGLSKTNSNARARAIVIHGADYVKPGNKIGRSYGCPALEMRLHKQIIDQIKEGALIYAAF